MKPDFALDFRHEHITLLHRQEGGWALVGRVAMDDPDLDAALGYLRATALGLSPRGISSKLILPNDAILYTSLNALPSDKAQRAAAIAHGLVGRTPYRVDDLAYDWTDENDAAHLAVIARETLIEAEGFATQHRFNPISFAALPDVGDRFEGEAWFGPTELAQTLLARGEMVERDSGTVSTPSAPQAAPAAQASSADFEMGSKTDLIEPSPSDKQLPTPESALDPDPQAAARTPSDEGSANIAKALAAQAELAEPDVAEPELAEPDLAKPDLAKAEVVTQIAADVPDAIDAAADAPPSFDAAMAELDAQDAARMDDEAPMALDVPLIDEIRPEAPQVQAKKPVDVNISAKGEGLLSAFAARRTAALSKAVDEANINPRIEPVIAPFQNVPVAADLIANDAPTAVAAVPQQIAPSVTVAAPIARKLGSSDSGGGMVKPLAPLRPTLLKPEPVVHVPAKAAVAGRVQNIKSMPKAKTPARIKPSIGLGWVLTAALLLSLMAAAAMSSYLMAGFNNFIQGDTRLATVPDLPPATQTNLIQSHAAFAESDGIALEQTGVSSAQSPATVAVPHRGSGEDQTLTLATRAPSLRPTSPDMPIAAQRAPELQSPSTPQLAPQLAAQSTAPPLTLAPQAAEETPVLAAVNPDELPSFSVPVITGAPPVVPAVRPAEIAAQMQPFGSDPALADARPTPRPSEIPAAILAARAANPPPNADPALAPARPAARPTGAMAAARAARQATASASLLAGTQAAVDAALNAPSETVLAQDLGPLNLAISRIPAARPVGLAQDATARIAASAVADAAPAEIVPQDVAAPASNEAAAPAQTAALEAYEEPEDVTGAAPSRSVVARQATQRNVLVMNDVALVGIFGNQAGRYALVRQPNGRFRKLKVGDSFDGGQVAAITESELRLAKGGQMVAMQMPRG